MKLSYGTKKILSFSVENESLKITFNFLTHPSKVIPDNT